MSGLARLGRSLGRAVVRAARRVEVTAGLLLTFLGLVLLREIGEIILGAPVIGASPIAPIILLAVAAALAIGFGVRFIFKGF